MIFAKQPGLTDEEIIEQARIDALPYEGVCSIKSSNQICGTGSFIKKEGIFIYVLTASHVSKYSQNIEAIFSLRNGQNIKCKAILAITPKFGPKFANSYDGQGIRTVNNDITVLKCVLDTTIEFNVQPLLLQQKTTNNVINRHETKFIGCGNHGINGTKELKCDSIRRSGYTNIIEYHYGDLWQLMSIPGNKGEKFYTLEEIEDEKGILTLNTEKAYIRADISIDSNNRFSSLDFGSDNELLSLNEFNKTYAPEILAAKIHEKQSKLESGDSGGPLLIEEEKISEILGIITSSNEESGIDYFAPVLPFKEWIEEILSGNLPQKTSFSSAHKTYLGLFNYNTNELILNSGTIIMFLSRPDRILEVKNKTYDHTINFNQETSILTIDKHNFEVYSYKSEQEAITSLMSSGIFKQISFFGKRKLNNEVLKEIFLDSFSKFLNDKCYFSEEEFNIVAQEFYKRYVELKEHGLEDGDWDITSIDINRESKLLSWEQEIFDQNRSAEFATEYNKNYPESEENGFGPFSLIIYGETVEFFGY